MKAEALDKSGSWIIGTIVALALREALTTVVPHIVDPKSHLHNGDQSERILILETIRLCVFIMVTIRFFLGSVEFFNDALIVALKSESNEGYSRDFLFGLVHFTIFLAWAVLVEVKEPPGDPWYLILLALILIYDVPWCIMRPGPKNPTVKLWAVINIITIGFSTAIYFSILQFGRPEVAEEAALIPVVICSAFDLWGILTDDPIIPKFIQSLI